MYLAAYSHFLVVVIGLKVLCQSRLPLPVQHQHKVLQSRSHQGVSYLLYSPDHAECVMLNRLHGLQSQSFKVQVLTIIWATMCLPPMQLQLLDRGQASTSIIALA